MRRLALALLLVSTLPGCATLRAYGETALDATPAMAGGLLGFLLTSGPVGIILGVFTGVMTSEAASGKKLETRAVDHAFSKVGAEDVGLLVQLYAFLELFWWAAVLWTLVCIFLPTPAKAIKRAALGAWRKVRPKKEAA